MRSFRGTAPARTVVILIGSLAFLGCQRGIPHVDHQLAERSLVSALEAWQGGRKPEDLGRDSPPLTISDSDWASGFTLISFAVQRTVPLEGRLRGFVRLKLRTDSGVEMEDDAEYVVFTSPRLMIVRELPL